MEWSYYSSWHIPKNTVLERGDGVTHSKKWWLFLRTRNTFSGANDTIIRLAMTIILEVGNPVMTSLIQNAFLGASNGVTHPKNDFQRWMMAWSAQQMSCPCRSVYVSRCPIYERRWYDLSFVRNMAPFKPLFVILVIEWQHNQRD